MDRHQIKRQDPDPDPHQSDKLEPDLDLHQTADDKQNVCLFEQFYRVIILYLEARIRIRIKAGVYILVENGYLFPPPPQKSIFFPQKTA